jgi:hypothetical protein
MNWGGTESGILFGRAFPSCAASPEQFVREIDELIELAPNIPSGSMRQRALKRYNEARQYYAAQTGDPTRSTP